MMCEREWSDRALAAPAVSIPAAHDHMTLSAAQEPLLQQRHGETLRHRIDTYTCSHVAIRSPAPSSVSAGTSRREKWKEMDGRSGREGDDERQDPDVWYRPGIAMMAQAHVHNHPGDGGGRGWIGSVRALGCRVGEKGRKAIVGSVRWAVKRGCSKGNQRLGRALVGEGGKSNADRFVDADEKREEVRRFACMRSFVFAEGEPSLT